MCIQTRIQDDPAECVSTRVLNRHTKLTEVFSLDARETCFELLDRRDDTEAHECRYQAESVEHFLSGPALTGVLNPIGISHLATGG